MVATIFLMEVLLVGTAVTAIVFGIQVLVDLSKSKITAWTKRTAVISIVLGSVIIAAVGIVVAGAFI